MEQQPQNSDIRDLLTKSRAYVRFLLTNSFKANQSLQQEQLIQKFKKVLKESKESKLEERFFTIFNDCYSIVDDILEDSTEKLDESIYNMFLISILLFVTLKHLNIQELSDFEEAIAIKLKEISSQDFDAILMIVNVKYRLHNYASPLDS